MNKTNKKNLLLIKKKKIKAKNKWENNNLFLINIYIMLIFEQNKTENKPKKEVIVYRFGFD